jgi:hypothetical protein
MTREEIIAQLESEISLLERTRDVLAKPLAYFMKAVPRKAKPKTAEKVRVQPVVVAAPVVAPAPAPAVVEPQVHRVPPRRRMERRQSPVDKQAKSAAALSGAVPAGPVAVSAVEARKLQERVVAAPPPPVAVELRPEAGNERSLGSLIQAFERRSGLNGLEIP